METIRSLSNLLLIRLGRTLAITLVAAAGIAVFAHSALGSVAPRDAELSSRPASGTVAVTDRTIVLNYHDGKDLVQERLVHRNLTGTFAGTEVSVAHFVIHPDGGVTIRATSTCTCTVEGRTGTVTWIDRGTVTADGVISVLRTSVDSTGGLAGIRVRLNITGPTAAPAQTYFGRYSFDDEA